MESFTQLLDVRQAEKAIILDDAGRILMTEGASGRINLPGGGREEEETPEEAFWRELEEELGVNASQVVDLRSLGYVSGIVGNPDSLYVAGWHLTGCRIEGTCSPGSEVRTLHRLSLREVIVNPQVTQLARTACQNYIRSS